MPQSESLAAAARTPRRKGVQHVFEVQRTEALTAHLVRIYLGGDAFDGFLAAADPDKLTKTDRYVKFLFPQPGTDLAPPYDLDALRERLPREQLPARRTYTVRAIDEVQRTIVVDFVVHGEDGLAGPWAASAQPGDRVALSGPGAGYAPNTDPSVPLLFLGDEATIPAIAVALEALGPDARGLALIEVGGADDEMVISAPAGVEVRWLHRGDSRYGDRLIAAVREIDPASGIEVFAHGEREAMKVLRRIFQDEWGLERHALSLSAYWANGRAEDRFQAEKREAIGQIFPD